MPWCRRRCPYCDFYFEVKKPNSGFGAELIDEFDAHRKKWPENPAATLYFGGGTPSLLPIVEIKRFLDAVKARGGLVATAEVTLEANPEDISPELVEALVSVGVNRISLGVQSFDDLILRQLGRKHDSEDALRAIRVCIENGIKRLSVDLIFGVPGENAQNLKNSIARLKKMGVGHLSAYLLTVEAGTALEKHIQIGKRKAPSDEDQADAYENIQTAMASCGYQQYEVSSYALLSQESAHNRNYWGKGAYLGLGPSAHSMRFLEDGSIERSKNIASITEWRSTLANPQIRETEILPGPEAFLESVSFGLRDLGVGVSLQALSERHKCQIPRELNRIFERSCAKGWVVKPCNNENRFYLTSLGVRFSDSIARDILSIQSSVG